jgi:hypothetical protein
MIANKDVKATNPAIASRDMLENEKYPIAAIDYVDINIIF